MSSQEHTEERPKGSSWRRWRDAALGDAPATPSAEGAAPSSPVSSEDAPLPPGAVAADDQDEFAVRLRWPAGGPVAQARQGDATSVDNAPTAPEASPVGAVPGEASDSETMAEDESEIDQENDDADPESIASTGFGTTDATDERDRPELIAERLVTAEPKIDADDGERLAGGGWAVDDGDHEWLDSDVVDDELLDALPAVPLLPALAGRLESIHGALATLAMRIDAVAAAMGSFRSTFGDRVDDYTETVAQLQRAAAVELDEQRRLTGRLVAELRRGVSDNGTALQRLVGRVDDVVTGLEGVEAMRIDLEAVRADVAKGAGRRDQVIAHLGVLRGEVAAAFGAAGPAAAGEVLAAVRPELEALGARLDAGLTAARDEIHLLKRRLAVRAKAPASLDGDQLDAIADAVMGRMAPAAPAPDIDIEIDIDTMAEAVAARVVEHLERRSGPAPEALAKEEPAPEAQVEEGPAPGALAEEGLAPEAQVEEGPAPGGLAEEGLAPEAQVEEGPAPEAQVEEGPAPGALAEEGPAPGVQATKKKPVPRVQATKKKPVPRAQAKKKPAPGAQAKKEPAPERAVRRRT
jgi:hypothetical protein